MDRQAVGLDQQQDEEGGDQKQVRRSPVDRGLGDEEMVDDEGQHRFREKRDPDENENQRRLGENRDHDRAARSDAAIGAARFEPRERDHEGTERQDQAAAENVAHVGQRQGIVRQNGDEDRNRQRRGEGDDRRGPVEPRGRIRGDNLLVEQLPEVTIGLKDARPLAALHALFELEDDPLKQGREQKRRQDLRDLKDDVPHGHRPSLEARYDRSPRSVIRACRTIDRALKLHAPVCQNWPNRSHQPRGRLKGELHRRNCKVSYPLRLVKRMTLDSRAASSVTAHGSGIARRALARRMLGRAKQNHAETETLGFQNGDPGVSASRGN